MRSAEVRAQGRRGWVLLRASALLVVTMLVLGTTATATAEAAGESLVLSVSAERVRGGVATPCGSPCQVGSGDAIRYAVTLENVSGATLNNITVSAPVPSGTSNDASASTIPSGPFSLIPGAKPTFIRQVTVNGVTPGTIITFSASATYESSQAAAGSPATHVAEVVDTRVLVLSVSAERVRGGVATPCPSPCQVGSGDAIRYAVTLENVSGATLNNINISAPVPSGTSNDASASTIPSEPFSLIPGAKPTFIRQVTVNGVTPGTIITSSASATYESSQAAAGSPATHVAEVVDTRVLVLSVSAERVRGGVATPCPSPCQVGSGDAIRYAVTLENVSGATLNNINLSAPVPSGTSNDAAASTIPPATFSLIKDEKATFIRQVTVNGPPVVQPGAIISFSASATYAGGQAAVGSPATHVAEVVNSAPVAQADAYETAEDEPLVLGSPGLVANDTDADGEPLSAAVTTGPTNGTVTVNTDGSFTYTPNSGFAGTDTFTYTVADPAGATDTATVTITVTPVDDTLVAEIRQPIDDDGSSVFSKKRGVVPVKFALSEGGRVTCSLPPAQIAVRRISGAGATVVDEAVYTSPSDTGSSFRREDCTYHYNLAASRLGPGAYEVSIVIDGVPVGNAQFTLAG